MPALKYSWYIYTKTLLFHDDTPWVKSGNEEFDVPMGSYDGAEVCELVGFFF